MIASMINLISTQITISNFSFQQFLAYDWVWILIFILIMVIVWVLLSKASAHAESEAVDLYKRIENEPVHSTPDDLSRIEGIGPKITSVLYEAGIFTFDQLAHTNVNDLQNILNSAGLRIAKPVTWPQQAELAAAGRWDDLEQLQQNLKGGL